MSFIKVCIVIILLIDLHQSMQGQNNHVPEVKILSSEFIYENAPFSECHASTIVETKDGLLAAWFGGTKERNPDVCIYSSAKINGKWSIPKMVADGVINDTLRYPCWNPVLFQIPRGPLVLFYKVGPNVPDWWGMFKTSDDFGKSWSAAIKMPNGILGPIKNKPVLINGNRIISPSSTESKENNDWRVHFEVSDDFGKSWRMVGPIDEQRKFKIIQPSILIHKDGRLQFLARSMDNFIIASWSFDNGETWSSPEKTTLPNPNSGTDAVTLKNGKHLIIYNHSNRTEGKWGGPRTPLNLAISTNGIDWQTIHTFENEPGEFSYPAIIEGKDGSVHISYTYNRKTIKYVHLKIKD